ncbi:MAG: hypothetical protein KJ638_08340 [Chloroflexi bacterium]|nr:hypothetical protein [Chloroflexota bacterium]
MTKQKKKLDDDDQVIVSCSKCGHQHEYESLEVLDTISLATPCDNCGFLFLRYSVNKMAAMKALLQTDSKAVALIKAGKFDEFDQYLKEKTEL